MASTAGWSCKGHPTTLSLPGFGDKRGALLHPCCRGPAECPRRCGLGPAAAPAHLHKTHPCDLEAGGGNGIISKSFPSRGTNVALHQKLRARPHAHRSLSLSHPLPLSPSPPRSDVGHPTHRATALAPAELAGLGTGSPPSLREQAGA